jgi:hypothetical protein
MTIPELATATKLSARSVRRWLSDLSIVAVDMSGRLLVYPADTAQRIREAVVAARAARADKVRAAVRRQWSKPAPRGRVMTVAEAKATARKGGRP